MNEPKTIEAETGAAVGCSAVVRLHWRYHRDAMAGVSKWVLGNNWVTKWDKDRFCIIGFEGQRTDWKVDRPNAAREAIECALMPPNVRMSEGADK
jgi:hypothetical protein